MDSMPTLFTAGSTVTTAIDALERMTFEDVMDQHAADDFEKLIHDGIDEKTIGMLINTPRLRQAFAELPNSVNNGADGDKIELACALADGPDTIILGGALQQIFLAGGHSNLYSSRAPNKSTYNMHPINTADTINSFNSNISIYSPDSMSRRSSASYLPISCPHDQASNRLLNQGASSLPSSNVPPLDQAALSHMSPTDDLIINTHMFEHHQTLLDVGPNQHYPSQLDLRDSPSHTMPPSPTMIDYILHRIPQLNTAPEAELE